MSSVPEGPASSRGRRMVSIGATAGIFVPVFFAIMWSAAVVVNGHWVLGRDTLSELGGLVPSRWIFNSAAIVSGIFGIIFSLGLAMRFKPWKSGVAGGVLFAIASAGLITVGIFSIDTGEAHSIATVWFFGFAALAAFTLVYPVMRWVGARGFPFITLVAAIILSLLSISLTPLPFAEAVTVASLQVAVFMISLKMIFESRSMRATG